MWSCFISHFDWCLQCHVLLDPNEDLWEWLRWFLCPRYSQATNYPPPCSESKTESITKTYTWRLCIFFLGRGGGGGASYKPMNTDTRVQVPQYEAYKQISHMHTQFMATWITSLTGRSSVSQFLHRVHHQHKWTCKFVQDSSGCSKGYNHIFWDLMLEIVLQILE